MYPSRGLGVPPAPLNYSQGLDPSIFPFGQSQLYRGMPHGNIIPPPHPHRQHQQQMFQQQQNNQMFTPHQQQLREQEKQKRKEQALAKRQEKISEDLFQAPVKMTESAVPGINAEKVLGKHKNAFSVINKSSCVGVDYQPPTPAPVQHIDEDDEDNKPPRKMPAMIKPQNNTRLPPNMENPRPASKPRPPPPSKEPWNNMAPPITPHMHRAAGRPVPPVRNTPPLNNYNGHPPTQKGRNPSLSNLKIDPKMNTSIEDEQVKKILGEVLGGGLPSAPLSGIITPRVEKTEDRGSQQHMPRYQTGFDANNFFFNNPPPSLVKRLSESDSDKEIVPMKEEPKVGKTEESSSSDSDESSDSDSETKDSEEEELKPPILDSEDKEDSDEDHPVKDFNLASFIKREDKTPPTSSVRTLDPSPRPYIPTPSPAHSIPQSTLPSPGFINVPELLGPLSPESPAGKHDIDKHFDYIKNIPDVIDPMGPDSESDDDIQLKRKSSSLETNRKPPAPESRRKPYRKRKREPDVKPSISKEFVESDSDSDSRRVVKKPSHIRATSSSPLKVHSPRKPHSAQSTPVRRHQTIKSPQLSESDDEEPPAVAKAKQETGNHKKKALLAMFGKKAALGKGGGKGKGGKGKSGGINFIVGERGEDEEYERNREVQRSVSPEPQIQPKAESKSKSERNESPRLPKFEVVKHMEVSSKERGPTKPLPTVSYKPNGRPSLIFSVPLTRIGRSPAGHRWQNARGKKGKDRWITKSDNEIIKKPSEPSLSERTLDDARLEPPDRPGSARSSSSRDRHGSGASRSSVRSSHRKECDRTLETGEEVLSEYDRKRRERESSPGFDPDPSSAKRLREDEEYNSSLPSSSLPPAHPTFLPGNGGCLMPPPRSYYPYFDRRHAEDLEDEDNVEEEAKRLKHEADHEENMEAKCSKYLEAIILFILSALKQEKEGETHSAFNIYDQTLRLIKYVMKPMLSKKSSEKSREKKFPPPPLSRLLVMSMRAQSLLNLKMYKLKKHELKELQKTISDVLSKSDKDEDNQQVENPHISPTPSPAGSEGSNSSKSSGYTSSGEGRVHGVLTPPTLPPVCLSLPKKTLQRQFNIASYLSQCHELWEQADLYIDRGSCIEFFLRLDEECGVLNLHSTLYHLVMYTRKGLEYISQELPVSHRSPLNPRSS